MRCSLVLSTMFPLGMPQAQAVDDWLAAVECAAKYDFDVLIAGQHFLHDDLQMFQPIPMLARAAAVSGRMRLGTGVLLLPLLSPVRVAEDMASLDCLTKGRALMGVGLGYREHEFEAFNVSLKDRVGRLTEGLEVIRSLWTQERTTYRGKHFRLTDCGSNPKPIQQGGLPVWIAAHAEVAVRRAARIGDAWLISPHSDLAVVDRQIDAFKSVCAELGKVPQYHLERETHIAETDADAIDEARPHLDFKYQAYVRWGQERVMERDDRIDLPIDELLKDQRFLVGSPETIVRTVRGYRERLGITSMVFHVRRPAMDRAMVLRGIELLGSEVLPRLADL